MPVDTTRVWTRFTPDKYQQMQAWSDQLGMTLSQFVSICAWTGAQQVMRTLEPNRFFTTEQWGQVIAAAMQSLPDVDLEKVRSNLEEAKHETEMGGLLPE